MRLILLTTLTMCAFAANSILTRLGVAGGETDPISFAIFRVLAGAIVLAVMVTLRKRHLPLRAPGRTIGVLSLAAYMIGFSLSYITLDAGLGALILFGTVQISMFGWTALRHRRPAPRQLAGAAIAFAGLLLALWPNESANTGPIGAALMIAAGIGWAAYTISGRGASDPLGATAANFVLCLPVVALMMLWTPLRFDTTGLLLAIASGAITSGLGYALWYRVLPRLLAETAAVVQLSVPIIAILAGGVLLGEALTPPLLLAAALVIGGIALAVTSQSSPADRKA